MDDMFDQSDRNFLLGHGWREGGGAVHGSLIWRDPADNSSYYTLEEALKLERRRQEQRHGQEGVPEVQERKDPG